MCYKEVSINPVSEHGAHGMYVPCGHCEDCRETARKAWSFRLCAEIEKCKMDGWLVGFCTLTYRQEDMPTIPKMFFLDPESAPDVPCMNKAHCRLFIQNLRKHLWREYRIKNISYMICSEFGNNPKDPDNPHRPHYHMVISWDPLCSKVVPGSGQRVRYHLTGNEMHSLIGHYWKYGFLFPRYPSGGIDSEGYRHKPFIVDNAGVAAARYAGKYCCKDVHFHELLKTVPELTDDEVNYKYARTMYFPFHIQSQSLGFAAIKNMTDVQKHDLLFHGMQFLGETKYAPVPVYIKNKLLFTPVYVVGDNGKRLVRREATEFFEKYRHEIFERKVNHYQELLREAQSPDFWLTRMSSKYHWKAPDLALQVQRNVYALCESHVDLAADYLAYYGVSYDKCYDVDRVDKWFARYDEVFEYIDEYGEVFKASRPLFNRSDFGDCPLISREYYDSLIKFWNGFFDLLMFTNGSKNFDFETDEVKSFFKEYGYAV